MSGGAHALWGAAALCALAVGYLLGGRQAALERLRVSALLRALATLWLSAPGKSARAVHEVLDAHAPELHDAFHDAADELEAAARSRAAARQDSDSDGEVLQ